MCLHQIYPFPLVNTYHKHTAVITDPRISSSLGCDFLGAESVSGLSQGLAHSRCLINAVLLRQLAKAPVSTSKPSWREGLFTEVIPHSYLTPSSLEWGSFLPRTDPQRISSCHHDNTTKLDSSRCLHQEMPWSSETFLDPRPFSIYPTFLSLLWAGLNLAQEADMEKIYSVP